MGGVAALVLMKYCSDGDNIPDAVKLCTYLNTLLNLVSFVMLLLYLTVVTDEQKGDSGK